MESEKRFYPDYLFEIILVIFLTVELLLCLALLYPKGIGRAIDFTVPYQPRPEWYFLWLYQLVRYFHGPFIFVGTVVIPVAVVTLIIMLPWIDRGRWGRLKALFIAGAIFLSFIILTLIPLFKG
jgi:quinol-cytochrome oxidoreductase complex cytochrome b subunit